MPKVLTVAARESFKAVLREYKKSSASSLNDRAHLQRWIDDDRAEQVWDRIRSAVRSNNLWLPPKTFIRDILAARPVAIAIAHRRKLRKHYRSAAKQMEWVAKFLHKPTARPRQKKKAFLIQAHLTLSFKARLVHSSDIFGSSAPQNQACLVR